jgi:hypothetical protein
MTLTCILVDMENVQLRVPELALLERGRHQLKIFHGPSQNKLTIEMVRALQPLGDAVEYVQCEKAGPNALDFHLAFHLGRLTAAQPEARYLIVSRDKGFAQLVAHANKLGGHVEQYATLPAGLGEPGAAPAREAAPAPKPQKTRTARTARTPVAAAAAAPEPAPIVASRAAAPKPAARKAPARKAAAEKATPSAAPAKKAPAKKAAAAKQAADKQAADKQPAVKQAAVKQAPARKAAAKTARAVAPAAPASAAPAAKPSREVATAADRAKAIATLQKLGAKRPVTQRALLRHLQSHLGHDLSDGAVQALVDGLLAAGVVVLAQGKLTYHLGA